MAMVETGAALKRIFSIVKMALIFASVFLLLQNAYQSSRGSFIETLIIDRATLLPSAHLINWIDPSQQVITQNNKLMSARVNLSVLNGCEGVEAMFLIIAAIAAFSTRLMNKLVGAVLGIALIYAINQLRIVSLYFAAEHNRALFSMLHGYLAPTFIIVVACIFFMGWMQWSTTRHRPRV